MLKQMVGSGSTWPSSWRPRPSASPPLPPSRPARRSRVAPRGQESAVRSACGQESAGRGRLAKVVYGPLARQDKAVSMARASNASFVWAGGRAWRTSPGPGRCTAGRCSRRWTSGGPPMLGHALEPEQQRLPFLARQGRRPGGIGEDALAWERVTQAGRPRPPVRPRAGAHGLVLTDVGVGAASRTSRIRAGSTCARRRRSGSRWRELGTSSVTIRPLSSRSRMSTSATRGQGSPVMSLTTWSR